MPETIPKAFCTTREAATMLGVSLRTAQLWAENGLLEAWKTDGGHRRIARASILRLLACPDGVREAAVSAPDRTSRPLSILVVEDEPVLRRLYEAMLSRWPMRPRVDSAGDGYEALIRIGHSKPDLLVTDLDMPGLDGFRMLGALCAAHELADMQIVVVTGLDEAQRQQGSIPAHIPVLAKPVPFGRLLEIAEQVLAKRAGKR